MIRSTLAISLLLALCSGTVRVPLENVKLRKASQDAVFINEASKQTGIDRQLLYDDVNVVTIGEVTVGTPPQALRVAIDTTIGDSWFPGRLCAFYGCGQKAVYDSSKSRTYTGSARKIKLGYELGTVYGTVSNDDVCIASFCSKGQTLIEAYQTTYNFWELPYDGVLGLGLPSRSVINSKNPILNIGERGALNQSVFTIWKARKPLTSLKKEESGMLTIGGYDSLHCSDFCTYTSLRYSGWTFEINGVSIGAPQSWNSNLTSAKYVSSSSCHIGTSTPFILGPVEEIMKIARALNAKYNALYKLFHINCDGQETLPPIWVNFQEASLPIYPDSYVIRLSSNVCLLAFQVNFQRNFADWTFGDPWMKQYCVVHEFSRYNRLGFCPSIM